MLELNVQYATPSRKGLPSVQSIRQWLEATSKREGQITVRFVGRREGRGLNRAYRGKDYATNVLSFPYDAKKWNGDLVLCAPVVIEEARTQGKSSRDHYAHLIVHGALHLQGWEHGDSASASKMEEREIAILATLGIANPYVITT